MRVFLFSFLLFICGCAPYYGKRYTTLPAYGLNKTGPFLVSESPLFWRSYREKKEPSKNIAIRLIIKNTEAIQQELFLNKATVTVRAETSPLECVTFPQSAPDFSLKKEQQVQVRCSAELSANSNNQLAQSDAIAKILIPTSSLPIELKRQVNTKDFQ